MTMLQSRDQLLALGQRFADILNAGNPEALRSILAPSYHNHNPYVDDGPDACVGFFAHFLSAVPGLRVTVHAALCDETNQTVIGRYSYEGTHTGPFMGFPPTGNEIAMRSIDLWRVEDGVFVEHWDELNTLDLFTQIGAARMVEPKAA